MSAWTDDLASLGRFFNRKQRKLSEGSVEESHLESFYQRVLTEVALSRFDWHNLPNEIPAQFIEKQLHFSGLAVFFHEEMYDKYFCLRGAGAGNVNVYDNYTRFHVYGNGMMTRTLKYAQSDTLKECVPIWANPSRLPSSDIVAIYARRLAKIDRTIDINVGAARQPRLLTGSSNANLSKLNLARAIDSGQEYIMVSDQLAEQVQALDMAIHPDILEKLHILRSRLYNECMGFLGIDNANQEKKERLIEGEVEANEDQTDVARATAMNTRLEAVEEINRRYGLNIDVTYKGKLPTLDQIAPMEVDEIG